MTDNTNLEPDENGYVHPEVSLYCDCGEQLPENLPLRGDIELNCTKCKKHWTGDMLREKNKQLREGLQEQYGDMWIG